MDILASLPLWTIDVMNISRNYTVTAAGSGSNISREEATDDIFAFCRHSAGDVHTVPFPSCYTWLQIICFALFMAVVMFVIVFGNLMVIISVLTNTSLKTVQNYLLVSLAMADCCVGALIMPFSLANELMGYWAFGDILCDSWLALDVLLCTASIYSLCAISLDRYWSVTQAVTYLQRRTPRRAAFMIAAVWITSLIISVPPLFGWRNPPTAAEIVEFHNATVHQTVFVKTCSVGEDTSEYVIFSSLGSFWIPLGVMTVVYVRIYMVAQSRASGQNKRIAQGHIAAKIAPIPAINIDRNLPSRNAPPSTLSVIADTHHLTSSVTNNSPNCSRNHSSGAERKPLLTKVNAARLPLTAEESNSSRESRSPTSDETSNSSEKRGKGHGMRNSNKRPSASRTHSGNKRDTGTQTDTITGNQDHPSYFDDDEFADTSSIMLLSEYDFDDRWREFFDRYFIVPDKLELPVSAGIPNGNVVTANIAVVSSESVPFWTRLRQFLTPLVRRTNPSRGYRLQVNKEPKPKSAKKGIQRAKSSAKSSVKRSKPDDFQEQEDRRKKRIQKIKERRATLVVTLVIATFVACWMPFFIILPLQAICGAETCYIHPKIFATVFWLGYFNSALNPVIYTIFNRDFRKAFKRVLFGNAYARKKANRKRHGI